MIDQNMNTNKGISFLSLGPGDPGLIPLTAVRILLDSDAIVIPTKSPDGDLSSSRTYQTLVRLEAETKDTYIKPFRLSGDGAPRLIPVFTPMRYKKEDWENQLKTVLEAWRTFRQISYVTLGDAGIYSTVYYLLDLIKESEPDLHERSEVIPGITSFSQASSRVKKALCKGSTPLIIDSFSNAVLTENEKNSPATVVYLRPRKNLNLKDMGVTGEVITFKYLNFEGESITPGLPENPDEYLTLTIDFH
jgi:precorrin-2/cobalt-factor-2 C20-methyltransferase